MQNDKSAPTDLTTALARSLNHSCDWGNLREYAIGLNQALYLSDRIPFKTVATSPWKMRRSHLSNIKNKISDRVTYKLNPKQSHR
ncbi:MAG: hypothetical protein ACHBN1_35465 [Heteroscytonema crispum UTEX LB 1556]